MRIISWVALALFCLPMSSQTVPPGAPLDSDHDGLSDFVEDALLSQFVPQFMVSGDDCSLRPAEFVPFGDRPRVLNENGTIYGQAFPRAGNPGQVELHYYHLWRQDCGEMSHLLDAEHVSALVTRAEGPQWKALYWYAAAHEDTVCDASQIARASTVQGELHGPKVWISRGKHASFLSADICRHGCGGDNCRKMEPLAVPRVTNLGERTLAMNGATWADFPQWPLSGKMARSDFNELRIARAEHVPAASIVWANPEKRRMQAAILGGNDALAGASAGLHATDSAVDVAGSSTGNAVDTASSNTGNGLAKAARGVKKALRATSRKLGLSN